MTVIMAIAQQRHAGNRRNEFSNFVVSFMAVLGIKIRALAECCWIYAKGEMAVRLKQWGMSVVGLLALAVGEIAMAENPESRCIVKLFDREDYKGRISVRWSKDIATPFELKGTDKYLTSDAVKLPRNADSVEIEGDLAWKHFREGDQKSSCKSKYRLADFTPAITTLRSQESWGKRMDKFVKELVKLEKQQEDRAESPSEWISSDGPVSSNAIKAAEQRLKFALPPDHTRMLQDYGAWSYGDSSCVSADEIDRADKQMRSIWGSPASEFASLSEKNKVLYQESVMLFVEAGDGYGALIYHPNSAGGEYFWTHQDQLDEPTRLDDSQGKPRDYSSTMLWLIANQILVSYEDAFPECMFIDRSATTPVTYELRLGFPGPKKMEAALDVEWSGFE